MNLYSDADIYLTTKHHKQNVIAPIFNNELKANIITCAFDTDKLGTFSGEITRKLNKIETAKKKCLWGLEASDADYGLASEGSFGPHPSMSFIPSNHEILYFIDRKLGFNLQVSKVSTNTNYARKVINSIEDLINFSANAKFPSHALIIRANSLGNSGIIYKGLTDDSELIDAFEKSIRVSSDRQALVETDMRAHMNPTRMSVIANLTTILVNRLKSICISCDTPGWGVTRVEGRLECISCGFATEHYKYEVFTCTKCPAEEKRTRSDLRQHADQANCQNCNP